MKKHFAPLALAAVSLAAPIPASASKAFSVCVDNNAAVEFVDDANFPPTSQAAPATENEETPEEPVCYPRYQKEVCATSLQEACGHCPQEGWSSCLSFYKKDKHDEDC